MLFPCFSLVKVEFSVHILCFAAPPVGDAQFLLFPPRAAGTSAIELTAEKAAMPAGHPCVGASVAALCLKSS
jgi:hypothetical protein